MEWANTKWGVWALFVCAFADASFLPLPTPMFFIALTLLIITKAYNYALFATLGTLTGGLAGYSIGHFAWLNASGEFTDPARFAFENIPGFTEAVYQSIHIQFTKWGLGILFLAPIIPFPDKLFSISYGAFDLNIFLFAIGTLIGRFYLLSFLIIKIRFHGYIKHFFELLLNLDKQWFNLITDYKNWKKYVIYLHTAT